MKIPMILVLLMIFLSVTILTDGRQGRDSHITSLTIQFDKTDATFIIKFDFDELSKMYLFMLGTKTLEPRVRSIFQDFKYEIIKIDPDIAILRVKNISVLNKGFYLHNSRRFNQTIDIVYISDPSNNKVREYYNINATPNYFYRS